MEPGDRSSQALNEPARTTSRLNLRIVAACVVLVGVAFIQSPGLLIADTKFDLAVDPANFLARALHLWDAEGAFGQLQNQAYGYLWPMGPFFALGAALDLQGWVVQRLWMALVMVVGFVGTARLTRALGVRSDLACLAAGFAVALPPRTRRGRAHSRRGSCCHWSGVRPRDRHAGWRCSRDSGWPWWAGSTRRPRSRCCRWAWSGC